MARIYIQSLQTTPSRLPGNNETTGNKALKDDINLLDSKPLNSNKLKLFTSQTKQNREIFHQIRNRLE